MALLFTRTAADDPETLLGPRPSSVLLLTHDVALREQVTGLAAAAGVVLRDATDAETALRIWPASGLILVGADQVTRLARLGPPRRCQIVVLTSTPAADGVFLDAIRLGTDAVVELPQEETRLSELLADAGEPDLRQARLIGVIGGSGGVGASTLACALGQAVAWAGGDVAVVDLDRLGPGLDRMLGLEESSGVRWEDVGGTHGRLNARALRHSLPAREGLGVITFATGPDRREHAIREETVREVVAALVRGHRAVIVDLGRGATPMSEEITARCDVVLVVVAATVSGVASARRSLSGLPSRERVRLVLRHDGAREEDVGQALGAEVALVLPTYRRVAESIDLGFGPIRFRSERLARLMRGLWADLDRVDGADSGGSRERSR